MFKKYLEQRWHIALGYFIAFFICAGVSISLMIGGSIVEGSIGVFSAVTTCVAFLFISFFEKKKFEENNEG